MPQYLAVIVCVETLPSTDDISAFRATPPKFFSSPTVWLKAKLTPLTKKEKEGLERKKWFDETGRGYMREQSTQPQTLGYSLADSPAGLLAWVYEKLVHWTDSYPWTDDESERVLL